MSVYLIARLNIHDRAIYAKYGSAFMDILTPYGGKLLSVEEAPEVIEGEWRYSRTVLLEFPSESQAHAWYGSADYQAMRNTDAMHPRQISSSFAAMTPNPAFNSDARGRGFASAARAG